jgi:DNA-binding response OmpR family regulator
VSRLLVVEDDEALTATLRAVLAGSGYDVVVASDGRDAMRAFHRERPDLVLLDIGLPEIDGWEVLRRIRDASEVPVLMLTAYQDEADKVRGLRGGADDYLTKPFGPRELVARVEALLRRSAPVEVAASATFDDGTVWLDETSHEARAGDRHAVLTPIEFRLLSLLARHPRQVFGVPQLLSRVWEDGTGLAPQRVKYAVRRLRHKLGWDNAEDSPIESVRGSGYRYRPADQRAATH